MELKKIASKLNNLKFLIKTYGCQMNERDSDAVSSLLLRHGYVKTENEAEADIIIVNTCSVRGKAEDKALGKLGLLTSKKHRDSTNRIIGAIGCMTQRLGTTIFDKVPRLDFAIGTHRLSMLPEVIDCIIDNGGPVLDIDEKNSDFERLSNHDKKGSSAFINILFGCNRRCSYCIVPYVRGSEWSRSMENIVKEVETLVDTGIKEITLLGQSVMSYGLKNNVWSKNYVSPMGFSEPFPKLLEVLNNINGLERIRFTSGHPSGCTAELARAMAELSAVCEHLHLPVQSGSDRILKLMRRGYTTDNYRTVVNNIRSVIPDVAITTDIIVGFPSESKEDFELTLKFMEDMMFDNSFIFKYSPRPDTSAFNWNDDVPEDEKLCRNKELLTVQDRIGKVTNKKLTGKVVEILVEGKSKRSSLRWSGRTRTNKIVLFEPVKEVKEADLINIRIEKTKAQTLYGVVI